MERDRSEAKRYLLMLKGGKTRRSRPQSVGTQENVSHVMAAVGSFSRMLVPFRNVTRDRDTGEAYRMCEYDSIN